MSTIRLILVALICSPAVGFAAGGMFDQYVIVNTTSSSYYDIGAVTSNPDFNGASLGTFYNVDSLRLGGQGKSFKNSGTDVTGMQLFYRVWQGSPTGTFQQLSYSFKRNIGGGGDQEWGTDAGFALGTSFFTSNLLSGLSNGTYNLEVYSQITTNGVNAANPIYNSNSGNNFTASFNVVPEPSRVLLSLLGIGFLAVRRRR